MEFSIKLHTIKSGWYIVYIEGSQVIISKILYFFLGRSIFYLAKSADPDEMSLCVTFHLGFHCLPKYALGASGLKWVS